MRTHRTSRFSLAAVFISSLCYPSFVTATVITVDATGKYQVDETKDFRQRKAEGSEITARTTGTSLDLGTTSEPFIARIIPPPDSVIPSLDKDIAPTSVETTVASLNPYETIIQEAVLRNPKLDDAIIKAVIAVESNYNETAVSPKGAMGLMQLMPATAERHGVTNPFDPEQNIQAGANELNSLMETNANISLALAAYNAGQAAVTKHKGIPPYKETQNYVVKVLTKTFHHRRNLRQEDKPLEEKKPATDENEKLRPMKVYTYDW